ncbi:uncharacterized protein LOC111695983 [Eurytemora carolleeae]|uniref:uncharacterized protein LOC111695983 n=1 Tax=Eurytemora carolleeae TaxID=1294199 RepID=UPI000C7684F9|nr:uncharacterized protein LOC111695983 [Eurytemora carolleeae]|eukprot:XP_023321249.1 uncharacterized protein LOC111695983 [Eurytemora affinis]
MNFLNSIQSLITEASTNLQNLNILAGDEDDIQEPDFHDPRLNRRRSTLLPPSTSSGRSSRSPSPSQLRTPSYRRCSTFATEGLKRPSGVPFLPTCSTPAQGGKVESKQFPVSPSRSPVPGFKPTFPGTRQRCGSLAEPPFKSQQKVPTWGNSLQTFSRSESISVPVSPNLLRSQLHFPTFKEAVQKWPQSLETGTGIAETDGRFFENFATLINDWVERDKHNDEKEGEDENKLYEDLCYPSPKIAFSLPKPELEQLYVEVLYTIQHKLGANSFQFTQIQDELLAYAKDAFGVNQKLHVQLVNVAGDVKPPIVILNVLVIEAENLEAKDPNGFSDPYCMLGIRPGSNFPGLQTCQTNARPAFNSQISMESNIDYSRHGSVASESSETSDELVAQEPKIIKKYTSFREKIGFKKKESPLPRNKFQQNIH